jgi:hypothetical protein
MRHVTEMTLMYRYVTDRQAEVRVSRNLWYGLACATVTATHICCMLPSCMLGQNTFSGFFLCPHIPHAPPSPNKHTRTGGSIHLLNGHLNQLTRRRVGVRVCCKPASLHAEEESQR